jgi:hypothetical protein
VASRIDRTLAIEASVPICECSAGGIGMIDLIALVGLFAEIFPATKGWRAPKVERVGHLDDMDRERVVIGLRAKGHEIAWPSATKLRQLKREGWQPVVEHDRLRRPTIFTDRFDELILVHRPKQG